MKPTQEQVIAWAREAGFNFEPWDIVVHHVAALAYEAGRKDENEACAKVCDDNGVWYTATNIRARREQ